MAKLLVFGGQRKEELLAKRQAIADKYYKRRREQDMKVTCDAPTCGSEEFKCLRCGKTFKVEEPPPQFTLDMVCREVTNYLITPLANYRRQNRGCIEQAEMLLLIAELQKFEDPATASVRLSGSDYERLRDKWTRYGASDTKDFEVEIASGPGMPPKTQKLGWGHLGEESAIVWLTAHKIVMEAADEA